jgi:hypothetical protein
MIRTHSDILLEVTAKDLASLEKDLNEAEEIARASAMNNGCGIWVTQHGFTSYTVAVSPEVPVGLTRERRNWTIDS